MGKKSNFVELRHLTKVFKGNVVAVNDISLSVGESEMITLLGPSGCGKTTTLRMVGGFEIPTAGEVYIDGKNVNDLPPNKRPTSMVFQSYALFPHMTVFDNIAYGLKVKKRSRRKIRDKVIAELSLLGLEGLENRYPGHLSGGQQQRVALARALVMEPKVMLFDEPLSNLDAKIRAQARVELKRLQKEIGITSLYVTHDQAEAMTLSDQIAVISEGTIRQIGTPKELYLYPQNMFVANFIGRANFMRAKVVGVDENAMTVELQGKKYELEKRADWQVGEEGMIMIRPETVRIVDTQKGDLKGRVKNSVYLGSSVNYEIIVSEEVFRIDVQDPLREKIYNEGEEVGIKLNPHSLHILKVS